MKLSRISTDDGGWDAFADEDFFRILVGNKWFDVQERDGGIFIYTSGRISVHPVANNAVALHDRDLL